jgi:hypothetical protein
MASKFGGNSGAGRLVAAMTMSVPLRLSHVPHVKAVLICFVDSTHDEEP